jgi:hypothetical protein
MQPETMDEKGDTGAAVKDSSLSQEDSVSEVEAAQDSPEATRLTRKLLRKLDTR